MASFVSVSLTVNFASLPSTVTLKSPLLPVTVREMPLAVRFALVTVFPPVASVTGPFHDVTNLSVYEKWPSAQAPADQGTILFNGNNQQNFQIRVGWNGHMELSGSGQPGYWYSYCGVWNVA